MPDDFLIARNPEEGSRLPYLLRIPLRPDGIVRKARDTWPRTSKVYCHRAAEWPADPEAIERVPTHTCTRRGAAIDLVTTLTTGKLTYVLADLAARPRHGSPSCRALPFRRARPPSRRCGPGPNRKGMPCPTVGGSAPRSCSTTLPHIPTRHRAGCA